MVNEAKMTISERENAQKVQSVKSRLILTVGRMGALQSPVALRSSVKHAETNWELVVGTAVKKKL